MLFPTSNMSANRVYANIRPYLASWQVGIREGWHTVGVLLRTPAQFDLP